MSFGIIIKKRTPFHISKENRKEYHHEKRCKELSRRGYSIDNIRAMTAAKSGGISEHHVEKMIRHSVNKEEMKLDGKL